MSDLRSIDELYRRHGPSVFRRARQILANDSDAHEVMQEVFLSLFENPAQFQGRSQLTTFLYEVTTHACLNRIRNEHNRARLRQKHSTELAEDHGQIHITPEQYVLLKAELASMPEPLDRVAVYYYMDGLTHEQIGRILDCSKRQVGNLLQRLSVWSNAQSRDSSPPLPEVNPC